MTEPGQPEHVPTDAVGDKLDRIIELLRRIEEGTEDKLDTLLSIMRDVQADLERIETSTESIAAEARQISLNTEE